MRTIVAGSRSYGKQKKDESLQEFIDRVATNKRLVFEKLDGTGITTILSGDAKGPDKWGDAWGRIAGVPVEVYPAEWDLYGKSAGFRRNEEMVDRADRLVAFHDGFSRGTKHVIDHATRMGIEVVEYVGVLE